MNWSPPPLIQGAGRAEVGPGEAKPRGEVDGGHVEEAEGQLDHTDGAVGGTNQTPVRRGGRTEGGRPCVHKKGGICEVHGAGAKLRWRPAKGRGGKWDGKRQYFYECDLGPAGNVVRQQRLPFVRTASSKKTTPHGNGNVDDNNENFSNFSTTTGGNTDAE